MFHEQKVFLRDKNLALADPRLLRGHVLPSHVTVWEGSGRLRVLSVIIDRAVAQNPGSVTKPIVIGNLPECEAVLIVPNYYLSLTIRSSPEWYERTAI